MTRNYHLGRRQATVDRTARTILAAAAAVLEDGSPLSIGSVARRAGVTRATVYNRFGSRSGLLAALAPATTYGAPAAGDAREAVRIFLAVACSRWAANPALYRHLPLADDLPHALAELLAAADALRPGCSLREAEDVLAALASFSVFDRLHRDGRRTPSAVAEILRRLTAGILA